MTRRHEGKGRRKFLRHLFHPFAAQAIDDARLGPAVLQKAGELFKGFVFGQHRIADIGPVETGDITLGLFQAEPLQDIGPGMGLGRGGETYDGDFGEQAPQLA